MTGLRNAGLSPRGVASPRKHGLEQRINARLAGLRQLMPADQTFTVHGQTLTAAQIVQALQAMADLYAALTRVEEQCQAAMTQARQPLNAELPTMQQFLNGFDNVLRGFYGTGHPQLSDYGIASGARTPPSSVTQAQAAATATLTRAARHTMGKRQRLAIKGAKATLRMTGPRPSPPTSIAPSPSSSRGPVALEAQLAKSDTS
jgi:hypothetical protein